MIIYEINSLWCSHYIFNFHCELEEDAMFYSSLPYHGWVENSIEFFEDGFGILNDILWIYFDLFIRCMVYAILI